jgi:signal transduction histidine kinase
MHERAEFGGGRLRIAGDNGAGTTVALTLPLR